MNDTIPNIQIPQTFPDHEELVQFVYDRRVNSSADGRRVLFNEFPGIPEKTAQAAAYEAAIRLEVASHL